MRIKTTLLLTVCILFLLSCKKNNNTPAASGKILFTAQISSGANQTVQIFSVNPDGSELTQITNFPTAVLPEIDWSPDRSKILYNLLGQIYIMNTDGSNVVKLTDNNTTSYNGSFSPDGKQIVYTTLVKSPAGAPYGTTQQLAIMNAATGSGKTQITNLCTAANGYRDAFRGTWSPDGARIAFITTTQPIGKTEIYTINTIGTDIKPILSSQSPNEVHAIAYSPDGSTLLFQNYSAANVAAEAVYAINASDGTNQKLVFSNPPPNGNTLFSETVSVSPNGMQIVVDSPKDNPKGDLYIVNMDGTIVRRLTNGNYIMIYQAVWR